VLGPQGAVVLDLLGHDSPSPANTNPVPVSPSGLDAKQGIGPRLPLLGGNEVGTLGRGTASVEGAAEHGPADFVPANRFPERHVVMPPGRR